MIPVWKLRTRGAKSGAFGGFSVLHFYEWSMQLDSGLLILVDFVYFRPYELSGSCVRVDGHICQSPVCNTQQNKQLRSGK